jgi:hypothetical protein
MTLEDLRLSMNHLMRTWVQIEKDNDGQIIIYTNMIENEDGQLVETE